MSPNKRIALNVVASYGRSLVGLFLSLFSARWLLGALGVVDYGLYGLVGGLTAFVTFANSLLARSTSRFYAFAVGQTQALQKGVGCERMEECRIWFNTSFFLHFSLASILIVIGYPIGVIAVRDFLNIPPDRLEACIWVWRMVCVSCFVSMVNVPFHAMYVAKQEIAEMTIYGLAGSVLNFVFLWYMVSHPGDWLVRYSVWGCVLMVLPLFIMAVRALCLFPECRFNLRQMFAWKKVLDLFSYSAAQLWSDVGSLFACQGVAIVVNKMLGPVYNASMSIGNRVACEVNSLSGAMQSAIAPAITNAAGADDHARMLSLSYKACKFSCLFSMFFSIPLVLELDYVLRIWLKSPPDGVSSLTAVLLAAFILDGLTVGLSASIEGVGKIGWFKFYMGMVGLSPFFLSYVFIRCGWGIVGVGMSYLITRVFFVGGRLYFSHVVASADVLFWTTKIFIPCLSVCGLSVLAGWIVRMGFEESFARLFVTCCACEIVFLPLVWKYVLTAAERNVIVRRIVRRNQGN